MDIHIRIRETWLSAKPAPMAGLVSAFATLFLVIGALLFWQDWNGAGSWMSADREQIFDQHQYWRLWTTLFVHSDEKHLLGNSFLFFILGFFLNAYYSFRVFPLAAFLMGGVSNFFVLRNMPAQVDLIGVSGVVFWMGAVWLTLYLMIETRKNWTQRILRAVGVSLLLFFPAEAFDPHISYRSHWIGFLFGVGFALVYYFVKRKKFEKAEVKEIVIDDDAPMDQALEKGEWLR
jgi:rhomboid protease GluP